MDLELKERFQNFENVLSLCNFFVRIIRWLCENFYNEKLEIIFCEYDDRIEILNNEHIERICAYHKVLVKFNDVMKNDFLNEEKKCDGALHLYETELVDFFYFCKKDNYL